MKEGGCRSRKDLQEWKERGGKGRRREGEDEEEISANCTDFLSKFELRLPHVRD